MLKQKRIALILAALSLALTASKAEASLGQKELEEKIGEAKILQAGDRISSAIRGDEVLIHKYKAAGSTDTEKDSKIEAVLIAKVICATDSNYKKVKVRFYDRKDSSKYLEVLVREGDLKAFASGAWTQEELLSYLAISRGTDSSQSGTHTSPPEAASSDLSVADGPLKEERITLLSQIKQLHDSGINTGAYSTEFQKLEEAARKNDKTKTAKELDRLNLAVSTQLKYLNSRGIKRTSSAANTSPSKTSNNPATTAAIPDWMNADQSQMEKWMFAASKRKYGDLAAAPGPFQDDRALICYVLLKKKSYGQDVSSYMPLCKAMNIAAARNDKNTLKKLIPQAFGSLHIMQEDVDNYRAKGGWKSLMGF